MATLLPGVVFDYAGDEQRTTLYSIKDGAHHPCDTTLMDVLRGKRIWVTAQGWVLAWDPATLATFLWNPHDGTKIALPSLAQAPPAGKCCAMSGKPTDAGGCTVVLLDVPDSTVLWYCRHAGAGAGSSEWVRHEYYLGGGWYLGGKVWAPRFIPFLATHGGDGKFYGLLSSDEYVVVEFSPEPVLTTATLAKPVELNIRPGEYMAKAFSHLLDIDGEFHKVSIFHTGTGKDTKFVDIAVNRMDFTGDEGAVRVNSIGDRAIIAGGSTNSFAGWCPASELGLLPNSVYWTNIYDGCLHVYDIGAKTEEVRKIGEGVVETTRKPFWMVPVHP